MASGIGQLFTGLAQGAQTGIGLNQNAQRIRLAEEQFKQSSELQREQMSLQREQFDLTKQQTLNQLADMKELVSVSQGLNSAAAGEDEISSLIETGKKLGSMDRGMRAPLVDQFTAMFQQKYGAPLAPVVVATLKKAKPEELTGMFTALEAQVAQDPTMQAGMLVKTLSDPAAASEAIMNLNAEAMTLANAEAAAGPQMTTGQIQKQKIGRQIAGLEAQLASLGQKRALMRSPQGVERLLKMEDKLRAQILSLGKELRADTTETIDTGAFIEERDRMDGSLIRRIPKTAAPTAGSNQLFNVVDPKTGTLLGRAVFNSQSNAPVMEGGGAVPEGAQLQRIGSDQVEQLEVGPDGSIKITKGSAGGLMASTQSKLEQAAAGQEQTALELTEIATRLRQKDLGASGVFIENFVNNTLGQIAPSLVQSDVTANRTAMVTARESAMKALRADGGNMSNKDAARIMQIFPSDGVFQSQADAEQKLLTVAAIVADRAAFNAGKLGRATITEMTPEQMKQAVKAGTLDARTAMRALTAFHPDYLRALGKRNGTGKPADAGGTVP